MWRSSLHHIPCHHDVWPSARSQAAYVMNLLKPWAKNQSTTSSSLNRYFCSKYEKVNNIVLYFILLLRFSSFCCYNKVCQTGQFIKNRTLFDLWLWRLRGSNAWCHLVREFLLHHNTAEDITLWAEPKHINSRCFSIFTTLPLWLHLVLLASQGHISKHH